MKTCSIPGCERPFVARTWCETHYVRWKRNGDPLRNRRTEHVLAIVTRTTKPCVSCRRDLPLESFNRVHTSLDGRTSKCLRCRRAARRRRNAPAVTVARTVSAVRKATVLRRLLAAERSLEYYHRHPDKGKLSRSKWEGRNRSKVNERKRRYRKLPNRLAYEREMTRKRQGRLAVATPPWADRSVMRDIYLRAVNLTMETGIRHEVDHIYPLHGKTCCGLHTHDNLQILTSIENRRKRNRMPDAGMHPTGTPSTMSSIYSPLSS